MHYYTTFKLHNTDISGFFKNKKTKIRDLFCTKNGKNKSSCKSLLSKHFLSLCTRISFEKNFIAKISETKHDLNLLFIFSWKVSFKYSTVRRFTSSFSWVKVFITISYRCLLLALHFSLVNLLYLNSEYSRKRDTGSNEAWRSYSIFNAESRWSGLMTAPECSCRHSTSSWI